MACILSGGRGFFFLFFSIIASVGFQVNETNSSSVRIEVLTEVSLKIRVFSDDTPCRLVSSYRSSSEMLRAIYQSTWHNIPWTSMSFYGAHVLSSVM